VPRRRFPTDATTSPHATTFSAPTGSGSHVPAPTALAIRIFGTDALPEHWLPLFPERTRADDPPTGLRLGTLPRPLGRILQPPGGGTLVLPEEEVPREGARVTRAYRLARSVDGSTHLWLARSKGVGRGEGSSGLRFDALEDVGSR
jgi:hypothetical protein